MNEKQKIARAAFIAGVKWALKVLTKGGYIEAVEADEVLATAEKSATAVMG